MDSLQALGVCCRSCDAAIDALEAATHGRDPHLPEEPVLMHVSRSTARVDAAFAQWQAAGVWPGQARRDSSGAVEPAAKTSPGVLVLSRMSLGIAALVLSKVPGYARLMHDGGQVRRVGPLPQYLAYCIHLTVSMHESGFECVVACWLESPLVLCIGGKCTELAPRQGSSGRTTRGVQVPQLSLWCLDAIL